MTTVKQLPQERGLDIFWNNAVLDLFGFHTKPHFKVYRLSQFTKLNKEMAYDDNLTLHKSWYTVACDPKEKGHLLVSVHTVVSHCHPMQ